MCIHKGSTHMYMSIYVCTLFLKKLLMHWFYHDKQHVFMRVNLHNAQGQKV
jgi:hypothetical protein